MISKSPGPGLLFSGRIVLILIMVTTVTGGFTLGYFVGKNTSSAPALLVGKQVPNDPAAQALTPVPNLTLKSQPLPSGDAASPGISQGDKQAGFTAISHDVSSQRNDTRPDVKRTTTGEKGIKGESVPSQKIKAATETNTKASIQHQEGGKSVSSEAVDSSHKKVVYTVQAGAFKNQKDAELVKVKLEEKGYNILIKKDKVSKGNVLFKVRVGEFERKTEAEVFALKLKKADGLNAFATVKN
jgi:cell division septation protein DedD